MGCVIFFVASYLVPSMGFVSRAVRATLWLSRGDVTQLVLLLSSLVLIVLFSRGEISRFGIQRAAIKDTRRSVVLSAVACSVIVGIGMFCVTVSGGPPQGESSSPMAVGGIVKLVVSVWVVASITEELFYRGLLMGFLSPLKSNGFRIHRLYLSVPVIVCAAGFALGHLMLLTVIDARMVAVIVASAAVLGFIAGYYREKSGSLIPAIGAHMTFNIVGAVVGSVVTLFVKKAL
jgi:membrane protease YdiL (CAAX protease family)